MPHEVITHDPNNKPVTAGVTDDANLFVKMLRLDATTGALKVEVATPTVYEVALDKANDSVAVWSNTAKDGSGTAYQPLLDADGHLQVDLVSGGGAGGTAMNDDAGFTVGTTQFTPAGGTYRSVRDTVDDNDAGAFAMTQRRALLTCIETPAGDSAMDEANDSVNVTIVAGGGSGGTAMADDAAFTVGTTQFTPVGGQTTADSVDAGDAGAFLMDTDRHQQIDIVASALPSGAATAANQLADGHNVTVDNAIAAGAYVRPGNNIPDATYIGDIKFGEGLVASTEVIGKVRLVTATGDEVTEDTDNSVQVTIVADDVGIGGGVQYAEDSGHSSGHTGTLALGIRNDANAVMTDTNLDYTGITTDSSGRIKLGAGSLAIGKLAPNDGVDIGDVDVTSCALPTGAATAANQLSDGHNVTVDNAVGAGVYIRPGTGVNLNTSAVTISTALPAGDNNIGNVDIVTLPSDTFVADAGAYGKGVLCQGDDGTDRRAMLVGTDGHVQVDIVGSLPAGSDAIGKLAANSGVDIGDVDVTSITGVTMSNAAMQITGDEASDAADAGNPVKIGGRAQDIIGAEPEEVADNDRVDALFDMNGRLGVTAGSDYKYADINDSTSGNNTIQAAAGAGKRIAVWHWDIISDGTVDCRWEDGAGGTAFTGQYPFQAREGMSVTAGGLVPLFVGSANTLLNLELSAAINVHGLVSYTVLED
jgi:hypothetical protein